MNDAGLYLQPEPINLQPGYQTAMAKGGRSVPAYSYALSNPVTLKDKDGKLPYLPDCALPFVLQFFVVSESLRGPHTSDGMLHCVGACYLAKNCGPGTGYLIGLIKEYLFDAAPEQADIRANALG